MLRDLVLQNRSYRRFDESVRVEIDTLRGLVDLARLSASARNAQPLRYVLSSDPERNAAIFECLSWARDLKDWAGPEEGERPSAYIAILGDTRTSSTFGCDHGIAAQSIMLGATEKGLGGCMMASVDREKLRGTLRIEPVYEILLVLALGKPVEHVVIDAAEPDADVKYWRDSRGTHHVPKRRLEDVIVG